MATAAAAATPATTPATTIESSLETPSATVTHSNRHLVDDGDGGDGSRFDSSSNSRIKIVQFLNPGDNSAAVAAAGDDPATWILLGGTLAMVVLIAALASLALLLAALVFLLGNHGTLTQLFAVTDYKLRKYVHIFIKNFKLINDA